MNNSNYSHMQLKWDRAPIWESAFKIAEAPMSYFNDLTNKYIHSAPDPEFWSFTLSFRDDAIQLYEGLKQRNVKVIKNNIVSLKNDIKRSFIYLYKYKHCIFIRLGNAVALPVTIGLTPISIITDIFAGIIQASVRLCQGAGKDEILSILHKKVIVSPAQQSLYLVISSTGFSITTNSSLNSSLEKSFYLLLRVVNFSITAECSLQQSVYLLASAVSFGKITECFVRLIWRGVKPHPALKIIVPLVTFAFVGDMIYCGSQKLITILPRFFRPDGYNVFIGGGAVDRFGNKIDFDYETTYSKWRREYEQQAHIFSSISGAHRSLPADQARRAFINTRIKVQKDLDGLTDAQSEEQFKKIRTWFKNNEDTYKLFGFSSSDEVTIEKLKKAYRSLTLKCHPDKVCDNEKKEAAIWFRLLNEARLNIEKYILDLEFDLKG